MKKIPSKGNFSHILFLVALLVVIFAIMIYSKSNKSRMFVPAIPEFEEPVKIIDQKYYNRVYNFGISLPSSDWEMFYYEIADSLRKQDKSLSLLENINVMLEMYRRDRADTLAIVQVGIIDLGEPRTPNSLAEQNLREIIAAIPPTDTIHVIKDVTLSSSASLKGAYYVIEFDKKLSYKYPLWVAMFVVHNKLAYTIFCKSRSESYALLRTDFETILKSFRLYK
jgi:hypothetical protein